MTKEFLYQVNAGLIFIGVLAFLLGSMEIGYWFGFRIRSRIDDSSKNQVTTLQGAMLAVLGLLLGFTFSMAVSRFDTRKQLVLDESNAIGTTYLRADLLPEGARVTVKDLLKLYVDMRLDYNKYGLDPERVGLIIQREEEIQKQLWAQAMAAASERRDALTALFIDSLNQLIDLESKRATSLENHVPETILILLFAVAALAMGVTGYSCGLAGRRNIFPVSIAALLIVSVILVVIDLDRPRRGLIRVSQHSMVELKKSLENSP